MREEMSGSQAGTRGVSGIIKKLIDNNQSLWDLLVSDEL
jgi:hypothetical protein